ncbi:hypothetical protein BFW38_05695 [Terasakiispira papahanaumokuakeensis]|uniref:YokE-like PH domain-containing protein n=1 Tax=Terasakiispira papahanaumokuakeensis TaxID=197479 RepID=A0A1E2V868_9GAMM|nr:hypothetical protein [Terasakiispira papahanaumokuakeensis]ODC03113.1 hypothetical protein BFW38_05695 [Terasakiispira papahanaumokuakeensis]
MSTKLLRNRDIFNYILEYDTSTGPLNEVSALNVPEKKIEKLGNYIKLDKIYYGVYATPDGPCFFFNNQKILLNDPKVKFEHSKGKEQHYFRLTYNGEIKIDLKYDHWDDIDIDPWAEEDFIDFFIWLTKSSGNQEFISMWTE